MTIYKIKQLLLNYICATVNRVVLNLVTALYLNRSVYMSSVARLFVCLQQLMTSFWHHQKPFHRWCWKGCVINEVWRADSECVRTRLMMSVETSSTTFRPLKWWEHIMSLRFCQDSNNEEKQKLTAFNNNITTTHLNTGVLSPPAHSLFCDDLTERARLDCA